MEPSLPAAPIARAIRESLASQHYLPAAAHAVPSLLVIYHWGLVNRNAHQVASLADVDPNLKARLALVATAEQAGEIENFLMNRLQGRTNAAYRIPENLSVQARRILDLTRHARWFMAVSAYDYDALTRHQPKLVWRVKMSTDQRADLTMAEALPVLLRAGGPFFGRHAEVPQILAAPLLSADEGAAAASISEETSLSPEAAKQVDRADLRNLIRQERAAFSWLRAAQGQTKSLEAESK